jgi:hypothetical protein
MTGARHVSDQQSANLHLSFPLTNGFLGKSMG